MTDPTEAIYRIEVAETGTPDELADALEYIASLLRDGYTSGYAPDWDALDAAQGEIERLKSEIAAVRIERTGGLADSLRYIHAARQAAHAGGGCPPGGFPCAACPPVLSAAVALDVLLADGNRPRACHPARLALHDALCRSGCEGTGRDEHARRQESTVREFRRFIDLHRQSAEADPALDKYRTMRYDRGTNNP